LVNESNKYEGSLSRAQAKKSSPLHILVVEDHLDTLRMLELFLQALGHRTRVARNVQEALAIAANAEARFDLLLSDIKLPDRDGWELLGLLGQAGRMPQRAIAMSGLVQ
jgi:CheY-like chemotaxis protein